MQKICTAYDKLSSLLGRASWLPPLLARITLGVVFVQSGWGKIHNIPKVTGFFTELGIPAPAFHAYFVSGTELVCGLLVLVGLFTRIFSIPLMVTMVVAIATAKKSDLNELSDLFSFSEYLYIVLLLWLVIAGPGRVSLDHLMQQRCRSSSR